MECLEGLLHAYDMRLGEPSAFKVFKGNENILKSSSDSVFINQ